MEYYRQTTFGLGARFTPAVKVIIAANVLIYVLQHLAGPWFTVTFGMVPWAVLHRFAVWQLVTYMFLHGGVFHLLFNLFTLWMFGGEVEDTLGTRQFVRFYFLTGVGGAVFYLLFRSGSTVPVIGASAAIYGVLVAFAVLFPHRIVTLLLFLVIPVNLKAWQLAAVFVGISVLFGVTGTADGVAHLAHLGGALVGYLLLTGRQHVERLQEEIELAQERKRRKAERKRQIAREELQRQVDAILDKINEVGYDNLTEEEKETLKRASKILAQHPGSS